VPKKDDNCYCINHPDEVMIKNDGFSAITSLKKEAGEVIFDPGSGVPIITYMCLKCGYIENYTAQFDDSWNR